MKSIKEIIPNLRKTNIVSIIGKVGTEKTTLATNIIKDFITDTEVKRNVAIYSLEDTGVSLISLITQVTTHKLNAFVNKTDFEKNKEIEEKTNSWFLFLFDGVGMTIKN